MAVTVYLWKSNMHDHISIGFSKGYVSFHPERPSSMAIRETRQFVESRLSNLEEDREVYRSPKNQVTLEMMDESMMASVYQQIVERPKDYNTLLSNCAGIVKSMLYAGVTSHLSINEQIRMVWEQLTTHSDHSSLEEVGEAAGTIRAILARTPLGKAISIIAGQIAKLVVDTPSEVFIIASAYARHEKLVRAELERKNQRRW